MKDFNQFALPSMLITALERMSITSPTPIQQETIPIALKGFDILASAHTGTGKTLAYLVPLIMKMLEYKDYSALILAPTRELAIQVYQTLDKMFGARSPFRSSLLIGGAPIFKQFQELRKKPRIIVGTPGRINDHLERETLNLSSTQFLVIDEADRMLDMGFGIQLDRIAEFLPQKRQTVMFSATLSSSVEKLSKKYLNQPQRIAIDISHQPAPKIQQETLYMKMGEKMKHLLEQLSERKGAIIVFVKTKRKAESLSKELREHGHITEAMHGDLNQRRREKVIHGFRIGKSRVLVATDVAARGLDIPHVMHVINYDLPECPEDYVHRIGRTGRAEAEGFALSFIAPEDGFRWNEIAKILNPKMEQGAELPVRNTPFQKKRPFKRFTKNKPYHKNFSPRGRGQNSMASKNSGRKAARVPFAGIDK